jgi:hypothetical protein
MATTPLLLQHLAVGKPYSFDPSASCRMTIRFIEVMEYLVV